jgi:site-specific DNA-methyltransferase (adenine-specific)
MKFDVCITNPPYDRNTKDLKILKRVIPHCKQTICIHPTNWLFSIKQNKRKIMEEYKNLIDGKVAYVEMFNGNKIFGIGLFVPVGIFDIKSSKQKETKVIYFDNEYTVRSLDDITVYGKEWSIVKPLFKKVKKYCSNIDNVWNHNIFYNDGIKDNDKYYCQLAVIRGDVIRGDNCSLDNITIRDIMCLHGDTYYTMVNKDGKLNKGIRKDDVRRSGNPTPTFSFDTEEEMDNFIEYLKTDFARFCLSFYKCNASLGTGELAIVPWLDFTKKWTDKELYKKFNVSEELQNYITTFIPDYHGIRG